MEKRIEKAKILKRDFLTNELTRLVRVKDPVTGGEIQVPVIRALYLKLIDMALHKGDMRALERLMAEVKGTAANTEMETGNAISKMTYMVLKSAGVSIGEGVTVTDAEIMENLEQDRLEQKVVLGESGIFEQGSVEVQGTRSSRNPDELIDFAISKSKKFKVSEIDF